MYIYIYSPIHPSLSIYCPLLYQRGSALVYRNPARRLRSRVDSQQGVAYIYISCTCISIHLPIYLYLYTVLTSISEGRPSSIAILRAVCVAAYTASRALPIYIYIYHVYLNLFSYLSIYIYILSSPRSARVGPPQSQSCAPSVWPRRQPTGRWLYIYIMYIYIYSPIHLSLSIYCPHLDQRGSALLNRNPARCLRGRVHSQQVVAYIYISRISIYIHLSVYPYIPSAPRSARVGPPQSQSCAPSAWPRRQPAGRCRRRGSSACRRRRRAARCRPTCTGRPCGWK